MKKEDIFEKLISIKYDVPNDKPEMFVEYKKKIDGFYNKILSEN